MTVLTQDLTQLDGVNWRRAVRFSVQNTTMSAFGIVGTHTVVVTPDANGVITTPDLPLGRAQVRIDGTTYDLNVPPSSTPLQLAPLIGLAVDYPLPVVLEAQEAAMSAAASAAAAAAAAGFAQGKPVVYDNDPRLKDHRVPTDGSVNLAKLSDSVAAGVQGVSSPYFKTASGSVQNADSATDSTTKTTTYGVAHYTNSRAAFAGVRLSSDSSSTLLQLGGGGSTTIAASQVSVWTAADNVTLTGTRRAYWDASGVLHQNSDLTVGETATGQTFMYMHGPAGQFKTIQWLSGGIPRWNMRTTNDAEVGGNAGTNWQLVSRNDSDGSAFVTVIDINRATSIITLAGKLVTMTPGTGSAGFVLPHGTTPTAPSNGALWTTTAAMFGQINGTTRQFATLDGTELLSNKTVQTVAAAAGASGFRMPHGTAPTTPTNGDTWTTTTGLFSQINGATQGAVTFPSASTVTDKAIPRFNGTTGRLVQNSGVTISDSNEMGIGTASVAGFSITSATQIQVVSSSTFGFEAVSYGGSAAQNVFKHAEGTSGAPTAVVNGDGLGAFSFRGHNGSGFTGSKAFIQASTTQDWTGTNNGTQISFSTTPNNTTTMQTVAVLTQAGMLQLPITTGATAGIQIAGDTNLYRNAASQLKTDASFTAGGYVQPSSASKITSGSGAPAAAATDGDVYIRTDTPGTANQRIYMRSGGAWVGIL